MAINLPTLTTPLGPFPSELLDAVAAEAEADADRVALFLQSAGLVPTPQAPIRLDADFLSELAAGLRLWHWEGIGLTIHREAGLPSAREALTNALHTVAAHGTIPNGCELPRHVLAVFIERFAWHGRTEWDATIALDALDEDVALDALAELLWSRRHLGGNGHA